MTVKRFTFNPIQENTFLVYDETNKAVVIDAGCLSDTEKLILKGYIEHHNLTLKRVLNTHLHFDHQFGNKFLYNTYGIKPEACKEDEFLLENVIAKTLSFGVKTAEEAQSIGENIIDKDRKSVV